MCLFLCDLSFLMVAMKLFSYFNLVFCAFNLNKLHNKQRDMPSCNKCDKTLIPVYIHVVPISFKDLYGLRTTTVTVVRNPYRFWHSYNLISSRLNNDSWHSPLKKN